MKRQLFRNTIVLSIILAFAVQASSCGTLFHPERRGQTSGRIDPSIAILDGIGLLFFIVPGLIAYAVDFSTGAIYLPKGSSAAPAAEGESADTVVIVQTAPGGPTEAELEAILEEHTGRPVDLAASAVQSTTLESPEEFEAKYAALVESGAVPGR